MARVPGISGGEGVRRAKTNLPSRLGNTVKVYCP